MEGKESLDLADDLAQEVLAWSTCQIQHQRVRSR